jgi:DNA-directed RNA polymerase specialized sigma24 family protein
MTSSLDRRVMAAFDAVSTNERTLLTLHDVARVSIDDIGRTLGVSSAQARIELRAARLSACQRLIARTQTAAA